MANLKEIRQAAGLSQSQLSEKSGINKVQISRIERVDINLKNISLENAVALAKALGVSAEDFLC